MFSLASTATCGACGACCFHHHSGAALDSIDLVRSEGATPSAAERGGLAGSNRAARGTKECRLVTGVTGFGFFNVSQVDRATTNAGRVADVVLMMIWAMDDYGQFWSMMLVNTWIMQAVGLTMATGLATLQVRDNHPRQTRSR